MGPSVKFVLPIIDAFPNKNIARIANAVQCHNYLSGKNDCLNSGSQLSEL